MAIFYYKHGNSKNNKLLYNEDYFIYLYELLFSKRIKPQCIGQHIIKSAEISNFKHTKTTIWKGNI